MIERQTYPGVTLYRGDCLELLASLGDVGAVVTDPPYGIDYRHGADPKNPHASRHNGKAIKGDDKPFDPSPLLALGVPCLLWGAQHFAWALPGGGRWLVWDKRVVEGNNDAHSDLEMAWVNGPRRADRLFRYIWKGFITDGSEPPREHPTQKPVALMKWCLTFVPGKEPILDPYMGSGTTGVACIDAGREFIGIESEVQYFDVACRRIEDALAQPKLFDATKYIQAPLS